jgi:hypothetical protein
LLTIISPSLQKEHTKEKKVMTGALGTSKYARQQHYCDE